MAALRAASGPTTFYNSAFLVGPDGATAGVYRKMHLVPFGEYVPAKKLLFFAAPLVEAVSDFSAGTDAVLLPVGHHLLSTAICYEVVYPDLVRRFVTGGSEMLTTITNDAWYGRSSAPHQHFEQAAMRGFQPKRANCRSLSCWRTAITRSNKGRIAFRKRDIPVFQPSEESSYGPEAGHAKQAQLQSFLQFEAGRRIAVSLVWERACRQGGRT